MTLTIGSLFSGIGGLELGLERAGLGPVLWQCEMNPNAQRVLAAHWPNARRFTDVRQLDCAALPAVDLVCGGFPCEDISSAGKRAGLRGARSGLWTEFRRVVSALHPDWVVVENVASGAPAWVDKIVFDLDRIGYAALPIPLSAEDVGAPHERARVFVVAAAADAKRTRIRDEHRRRSRQGRRSAAIAADDGAKRNAHRESEHACAVHRTASGSRRTGLADSAWRAPVPGVLRVADGISSRLDGSRPRIACLGKAVVPAQAEVIGHIIQELRR